MSVVAVGEVVVHDRRGARARSRRAGVVYIVSFAVGLGSVFWLMISEIFPLPVRSAAMSVSTVGNWTANFLVSSFFLTLTSAITRQGRELGAQTSA